MLPTPLIGWAVLPIGLTVAIWILATRMRDASMSYRATVGAVWTLIAVALDYVFIVKMFQPPDGYYKPDVYFYYALTFATPLVMGLWRPKPADATYGTRPTA